MPTIKDVARKAGVSVATVSAVVNGSRRVSDKLRDRVQSAIAEMDYRPNQIARALYTKRTRTFGMLIPSLDNPFFARLLKVAEGHAHAKGYSVLVGSTDGDPEKALSYGNRLFALGVDGLLVTLSWEMVTCGLLNDLTDHGIPVVGVGGARALDNIDCFVGNDTDGAANATRYLMALGHRDIAFMGTRDSKSTELRLAGYHQALDSAGIQASGELKVLADGYTEADAHAGVLGLLSRGAGFTAVVAFNDVMAMGVQNALEDQGFTVPGMVSVVGFDNTVAEYTRPKLTTVDYPVEDLGRLSVAKLLSRLEGDDSPPSTTVLPTRLVVRESTRNRKS